MPSAIVSRWCFLAYLMLPEMQRVLVGDHLLTFRLSRMTKISVRLLDAVCLRDSRTILDHFEAQTRSPSQRSGRTFDGFHQILKQRSSIVYVYPSTTPL